MAKKDADKRISQKDFNAIYKPGDHVDESDPRFVVSELDCTSAKMMPMLISFDIGNSNIRMVALYLVQEFDGSLTIETKEVVMPHAVIELNENEWDRVSKSKSLGRGRMQRTQTIKFVTRSENVGGKKVTEYKYLQIGDLSKLDHRNKPIRGSSKYVAGGLDAFACALFAEGFGDMFPNGHDNIIFDVGVPATQWQYADEALGVMEGVHRFYTSDGKKMILQMRKGMPYDESSGGVTRYLQKMENGDRPRTKNGTFEKRRIDPGDQIVVFDGGGLQGAMAIGYVSEDMNIFVDWENAIPVDGGIVTVRNQLRSLLISEHRDMFRGWQEKQFTDAMLDKIIEERQYVFGGDKDNPLQLGDLVDRSLGYLVEVKRAWEDPRIGRGLGQQGVLMTGGTIKSLHEYIEEVLATNKNLVPADDLGQIYMANCRGGLEILKARLHNEGLMPVLWQFAFEGEYPHKGFLMRWE